MSNTHQCCLLETIRPFVLQRVRYIVDMFVVNEGPLLMPASIVASLSFRGFRDPRERMVMLCYDDGKTQQFQYQD